ncbi:MAG: acetyl-CoA carboxylase biotin carboxyl carrier protein [Elusimicrobia bacterium]|nr:acetyl-CoA carboxylase biotin carboxyl carrier protein [Elusimicrobiota bacterium]
MSGAKPPMKTPPRKAGGVLQELREAYGFMQEQGLQHLEIADNRRLIRLIRRSPASAASAATVRSATSGAVPWAPGAPAGGAAPASAPPVPQTEAVEGPAETRSGPAIRSPMMGIFYRSPTPSSPPFVREGGKVKEGQTLCLIEAMKVFNEIKAEFPCKILKALIEDGKPVKVNQDLFAIELKR